MSFLGFGRIKKVPEYVPERLNIFARQTKGGLETYASADLDRLDAEYKRQLEQFFLAVVEKLRHVPGPVVDREVKSGRNK